ncbi:MAG: glycoside hydrolase family 2 protein [Promethearchaeota archaeon]
MSSENNSFSFPWKMAECKIPTRWSREVVPERVLPEYPRPQLKREEWINLNGLWDHAVLPARAKEMEKIDGKILVPFPIESALSGVKKPFYPWQRLWYRRSFEVPGDWAGKKVILHFGGVDYSCEVHVNGKLVGMNSGGHVPFSFDITKMVNFGDENNELVVVVSDKTGKSQQERGKQSLKPFMIYYTAVSGIWQTVWLEPVSDKCSISRIIATPDIDKKQLFLDIETSQKTSNLTANVMIKSPLGDINANNLSLEKINIIEIPEMELWSPDSPFLYEILLDLKEGKTVVDHVESYFGMRKIDLAIDTFGVTRIRLNNQFIFQNGLLDQGWWPDGLYTAPTDEALANDIALAKQAGYNMLRKHVKIEPARWYFHCDKIGMIVWQDMPSGGKFVFRSLKKSARVAYYRELERMIEALRHFPSIIVWVPFNEGWGQFQTKRVTSFIREKDKTRLVDSASGWFDKKCGDIHSIHKYPGPSIPKLEKKRAVAISEFGGLGLLIKDHAWNKKRYFAYKTFPTSNKLEEEYEKLVNKLSFLISKGLSAAVYTQLTDVEGEINGIMTYDRKIMKMDLKKLFKIHDRLFKIPIN